MKDDYILKINNLGSVQDIYNAMQEAKDKGIPYLTVLNEYLAEVNNILYDAIEHDQTMKLVYEYVENNNELWVKDYTDLLSIRGFSNVNLFTSNNLSDLFYGYATIVVSKDGVIIYASKNSYLAPTPNGNFYHDGTFKVENGKISSIFRFNNNYDGSLKNEDGSIAAGKGEYEVIIPEGATMITGSKDSMNAIFDKLCAFNNITDVINAKKGSLNSIAINDLFDSFSNTEWNNFAKEGDELIKNVYEALI